MTELGPWPLLRELGPEFLEVAVRAQVAWHGPTAAWAIASDLGVGTLEVTDALRGLRRAGEISAVLDTSGRERRWVLVGSNAGPVDLWAFTLSWLARRSFTDRYVVTCPAGELELTVGELIGYAEADGAAADGGVREHLAVLADKLEARGDPWGLWIASLLSGSTVARREHGAALAEAVRAKKVEEHPVGLVGQADAMQEFNRALAQVSAAFEW